MVFLICIHYMVSKCHIEQTYSQQLNQKDLILQGNLIAVFSFISITAGDVASV